MIQLSILKIMGYGPWTLTLGSDREHELQMLQASLYRETQRLFSDRGCAVFLNRADELFAISNGLSTDGHVAIQQKLRRKFDVQFRISIGCSETPLGADRQAHNAARSGAMLDKNHDIFGSTGHTTGTAASVMHLDVDGLGKMYKSKSPYETSCMIFKLYHRMQEYFLARESLSFFMGGDNFMVAATDDAKRSAADFIQTIRDKMGVSLNCGIGNGTTARDAVRLATKSLDHIREVRDSGSDKPDVYELSC